jgi:hypothetical protein
MQFFSYSGSNLKKFAESLVQYLDTSTEESLTISIKKLTDKGVEKYTNGGIKNIRSIVDGLHPVLVLISYDDARKELEKYFNLNTYTGKELTTYQEGVQSSYVGLGPKQKADAIISGMLKDLEKAIKEFTKKEGYKRITYQVLQKRMVIEGQLGIKIDQVYDIINRTELGAEGSIDKALVFPNFNSTTAIKDMISDTLTKYLKKKDKGTLNIDRFLDFGHAIGITDDAAYGNFPKNTQIMLSRVLDVLISPSNSLPSTEVMDVGASLGTFLQATAQIDNSITVSKQFAGGFLKIFVEHGGQVIKLENSVLNQLRGSVHEKNYPGGSGAQVLAKLNAAFIVMAGRARDEAIKRAYSALVKATNPIGTRVIKQQGSPSFIDQAITNVASALAGTKSANFTQKNTLKSSNKKKSVGTVKTVKVKINTSTGKIAPANIQIPAISKASVTNLLNLQNLINQDLAKQIQSNMGTGNSTRVLNYRTGRFAESAEVKYMSESRAGMITAFYSYMRNPYGTFAEGGAQESPASRNPKLLIAKSIRQLAGVQVANRMRAVLV